MQVRVLFFARSRELAGTSETSITLEPGSTTAVLLQQLLKQVRAGWLRGVSQQCPWLGRVGVYQRAQMAVSLSDVQFQFVLAGSAAPGCTWLPRFQSQFHPAPCLPPPPCLPQYPQLEELHGSFVFSLNQEYLAPGEEQPLKGGDEVAVIPPISGG